jgi:hypothetical protein
VSSFHRPTKGGTSGNILPVKVFQVTGLDLGGVLLGVAITVRRNFLDIIRMRGHHGADLRFDWKWRGCRWLER